MTSTCKFSVFKKSLLGAAISALSCGVVYAADFSANLVGAEDASDVVYSGILEDGKVVKNKKKNLDKSAINKNATPMVAITKLESQKLLTSKSAKSASAEKIHPALKSKIADYKLREQQNSLRSSDYGDQRVLVTFKETFKMPRFPNPDTRLSRSDAYNIERAERAEQLVGEIKSLRAVQQERLAASLYHNHNAQMVSSFWLINALVLDVPVSELEALSRRADVIYMEPAVDGAEPPASSVATARGQIKTDPYFNLGLTSGYIGLLDTGVRSSHTLFQSPSNLSFHWDCTDGTCNSNPNPDDDCWNHGTSTAAIISGNNNLGNATRGVTDITLDSFKVYPASCGGLSTTASVAGFQRSVQVLDRVVVAEMQGGGSSNSAISLAADAAFDAGAAVVSANGNNGSGNSPGTVNTPGNAHKVLGIGAYDVTTGAYKDYTSEGPASDGRIKPDLIAPTDSITASNTSSTATRTFTGTSGATPFAAGATALMRNFLLDILGTSSVDPGQVYSAMILTGQQAYPFTNTQGAGKIVMPLNGNIRVGNANIVDNQNYEISISVGSGKSKFEAALWWPESETQTHNDIDLYIIDPSGTTRDYSISSPSIFERATYSTGTLAQGTWKVRIRGYNVTGTQKVYWTSHVR
ncbi:subtilase family protein [Alteromonadaceae bacterium 2753L.S.0a.02]|nr:subtilase family protein [Alteromonadaceae bacterium 2753L.S.0a.02]